MTLINYQTREINCKIVYYGPANSGKTRNLKTIFERTPPANRGDLICLTHDDERTSYFDFLPLFLGRIRGFAARLHLYSIPGTLSQDSNRRMILKGVDGLVFVADLRREKMDQNLESMEDIRQNLLTQGYEMERIPLVFQFNMGDFPTSMPVEELSKLLNPNRKPQFEANAKTGVGVIETLKEISHLVLKDLIKAK